MKPALEESCIAWDAETTSEFIELWNRTSVEKVAERFNISRNNASTRASKLRDEGVKLVLRANNEPPFVSEPDRERLNAILLDLCFRYGTCPADVLSRGKIRDGRCKARRAIAWVAHCRMHLSLKQVGDYLRRAHPTVVFFCSTVTAEEQQRALAALIAYDTSIESHELIDQQEVA